MVLSRNDLVAAIVYWGAHGKPVDAGSKLTEEASKLVDVLGRMDFEREASVRLGDGTERAELVRVAQSHGAV